MYLALNTISGNKSRDMRWAGHVVCMGERRGTCRVLVAKPAGKRLLGRPMRRWENNIKRDHREIRIGKLDWIHLAQERKRWRALINAVTNNWFA
jgi:hypothetical protein